MRIITYNIMDGGEGRADPIAEVIEAQRADVVTLTEATDHSVVERIANRLKMDFIVAPGSLGASAVLSKWPINETINHALVRPGLSRSLLEVKVTDPSNRAMYGIGVIHLHAKASPADEQKRMAEVEIVLNTFAGYRRAGWPHFLCGDFNSVSPIQKIDPNLLKPSTKASWDANGGKLPRDVIADVLDDGYIDTLAACEPKLAETIGTFTTQHPGQRIDYIFAWGLQKHQIKKAWVEQDRLAKYASDHFPVGAEIG